MGAGMRPCIYLDPNKVKSKTGNGTLEAPYQLATIGKGKAEEPVTPPVTPPEQSITPPTEVEPEKPENDIGTDTIRDLKNLHKKNNNLGAGASTADFPIFLNGGKVTLSTRPVIIKGTTYLPVRALGELLGLKVDYDEKESVAILEDTKTRNRLDLPLDYTHALHNGSIVPIDTNDTTKGILDRLHLTGQIF
ncbi:MAG TPA: copper amine oxidase N-terminal domain-containing protein [Epulopiscium sp.]|nr:copper amine oxidase N-terminal domain-containing protein [Candidatus Epulonipiscium sp.]